MATDRLKDEQQARLDRWDPRQRFRPYLLKLDDKKAEWLAGSGCERETGIVPMLITLYLDGEMGHYANTVGVLDTLAWSRGRPATWRINPYPEKGEYGPSTAFVRMLLGEGDDDRSVE